MNLLFQAIAHRRNAVHFSDREVSEQLLRQLLQLSDSAPSGFNLQPWRFITVKSETLRHLLFHVTLEQKHVLNAPVTVVFAAKHDAWKKDYDSLLQLSIEKGALTEERAALFRKAVNRFFQTGPLELYGFMKRVLLPFQKRRHPTPDLMFQQSDVRHYMELQTMMAAATFMIAAEGAGLVTNPMQGFDEYRLKRLLKIPSSLSIPILVACGYPSEKDVLSSSVRLPLEDKLFFDTYK